MKALGSMHLSPSIRSLATAIPLVLGLGLLAGCGGKTDELSKELASLQKELGRLRSANLSLQDRVDMLEENRTIGPAEVAGEEQQAGDDRPVLEVVRLSPQESLAEPEPVVVTPPGDPNAPRPVIVGDGQTVERVDDEAQAQAKAAHPSWRKKR